MYDHLLHERLAYSNEYRELLQLKQQLTYAASKNFLYSSDFSSVNAPEVVELKEKDIVPEPSTKTAAITPDISFDR